MSTFSLTDIHRELQRGEYGCIQYPHVILKFLPSGTLQVFGEQKFPIVHKYTLVHRDDIWIMTTSPHLMNEPAEMRMELMKNHMTLFSNVNDEVLHFNKTKFSPYDTVK